MKTLRSVKGMHDILQNQMPKWHFIENSYRNHVERFGFAELRTPVLEPVELFVRGIGETTDIVEKEMYAFKDKGGDYLALRPEGTASAIRAYVQHNVQAASPQTKWYYLGPMFRRERPAKGRYRQFYQAGAELIGTSEPAADAEIILMAYRFIESIGISGVEVQLNTLGDEETRPVYRQALVEYFGRYKGDLCGDCHRRLEHNPLRILDCKREKCAEIAADAPSVHDFLSKDASFHFEEVRRLLERSKAAYTVVPSMVRGLDYYTRTIFEVQVKSSALGAGAAILGGGRYDNLIKQLGGRGAPAIGFSFGIERLLMILHENAGADSDPLVYIAGAGEGGLDRAYDLADHLRGQGFRVQFSYAMTSLKSQLKRADKLGATVTIIAGEEEARRGCVTWRDMQKGVQKEVPMGELATRIEAIR